LDTTKNSEDSRSQKSRALLSIRARSRQHWEDLFCPPEGPRPCPSFFMHHGLPGAPTRPHRSIEGCGNDVTSLSHAEASTSKYCIVSHSSLSSPAGVLSQCESRTVPSPPHSFSLPKKKCKKVNDSPLLHFSSRTSSLPPWPSPAATRTRSPSPSAAKLGLCLRPQKLRAARSRHAHAPAPVGARGRAEGGARKAAFQARRLRRSPTQVLNLS